MATTLNITVPLSSQWPAVVFAPDSLLAYRLAVSTYFAVGALSVFVWDMFYNLANDYDLAKTHKGSITSIIYFVSRFSTLAFMILQSIVLTLPLDHCGRFHVAVLVCYNLLISTTMLLSYFRVCAVWGKNKAIVVVFGFLWLSCVACTLTSITGITFASFPGVPYCSVFVSGNYVSAAVIGPTVNHILVFVAITYGVCMSRTNGHQSLFSSGGYRTFIFGESLPAFSKAILQSSQLCYLVAGLVGLVALTWFYVFHSDAGYRLAIFTPYAAVVNIMFSWVFRKAKLDLFTVIIPTHHTHTHHTHTHSSGNSTAKSMSRRQMQNPTSAIFKLATPSRKHSNDNRAQSPIEYELDSDFKNNSDQTTSVGLVQIGVEKIVEFERDNGGGDDKPKSGWRL
ncbi:hypothetical protein CPC08DRAFT_769410 [Agrocybe pediades]|nr:hypothetical protein CPC08DRAFT_769410 [Agrocybe pediades]